MHPETEALIERHRHDIPGIGVALSPPRLGALICQRGGLDEQALRLQPTYIRLKPASSCLVAFRGEYDGREFHCHVKALGVINESKMAKARHRAVMDGPLGPGAMLDDAHLLVISFYPFDLSLRGLRRYLANHPQLTKLAYKPERRFVGLAERGGQREVVKVYKRNAYDEAKARAEQAQQIEMLPRLRASDDKRFVLHLEWIEGETLSEAFQRGDDVAHLARSAGRELARLHETPPPADLDHKSDSHRYRHLSAMIAGINEIIPRLAPRILRLGNRLLHLLQEANTDLTLTHGDFYANQILITDNGIRLLDFDEIAIAPASSDVGLFLAHLEYDILRERLDEPRSQAIGTAFCEGYRSVRTLNARLLNIHTLFGMIQLLHRPFRDILPDWPARTLQWLERMERLLASIEGEAANQRSGVLATTIPTLRAALKDSASLRRIEQILMAGCAHEVREPRLDASPRRIKAGRRALVGYRLSDAGGNRAIEAFGKIRVKGCDHRTWRLNQHIHDALSSRGPGVLRIPRPLGIVEELDMWLQEKVTGHDGWSALRLQGQEVATLVARALHEFHCLDIPGERTHLPADELAILEKRLRHFASVSPDLKQRAQAVLDGCRRLVEGLVDRPTTLIHRDFYPDQVLVRDGEVILLDLDLAARGDAALDMGNFIAHIQEYDLRKLGDPRRRDALSHAMVAVYENSGTDTGYAQAVDIYRVLTLARHIDISTGFEDRRRFTTDILEFTEFELNNALRRLDDAVYAVEM